MTTTQTPQQITQQIAEIYAAAWQWEDKREHADALIARALTDARREALKEAADFVGQSGLYTIAVLLRHRAQEPGV